MWIRSCSRSCSAETGDRITCESTVIAVSQYGWHEHITRLPNGNGRTYGEVTREVSLCVVLFNTEHSSELYHVCCSVGACAGSGFVGNMSLKMMSCRWDEGADCLLLCTTCPDRRCCCGIA